MTKQIISRFIVPAIGAAGIIFALLFTTVLANPPKPPSQQLAMPVPSPFDDTISGSGVVEANSRNIEISAYLSGIVAGIDVREGQDVALGAPLFRLDDRAAQADFMQKQAELLAAEAGIREAQAELAEKRDQLKRAQNLQKGLSVSAERVEQNQLLVNTADARVKVSVSRRDGAKAQLEAAQVELERLTVKAPIAGRVLQINIQPGEYVNVQGSGLRPIIMGNVHPLHVRASIDENDLWRFREGTEAKAALRGNSAAQFNLKFIRTEPLVIPKRSLTGETAERVDTRVMDVIYEVESTDQPLYVGQLVDVFISAAAR